MVAAPRQFANRVALATQIVLLIYLQLILWVNLCPWNDIREWGGVGRDDMLTGVVLPSTLPTKFRILFQVPYTPTPFVFYTLLKTAGVYPNNSQNGTLFARIPTFVHRPLRVRAAILPLSRITSPTPPPATHFSLRYFLASRFPYMIVTNVSHAIFHLPQPARARRASLRRHNHVFGHWCKRHYGESCAQRSCQERRASSRHVSLLYRICESPCGSLRHHRGLLQERLTARGARRRSQRLPGVLSGPATDRVGMEHD